MSNKKIFSDTEKYLQYIKFKNYLWENDILSWICFKNNSREEEVKSV